jgi:hypothetical protein
LAFSYLAHEAENSFLFFFVCAGMSAVDSGVPGKRCRGGSIVLIPVVFPGDSKYVSNMYQDPILRLRGVVARGCLSKL